MTQANKPKPTLEDLRHQIAENMLATSAILKEAGEQHAKDMAEIRAMIKEITRREGQSANKLGFSFERSVFRTLRRMNKLGDIRLDDVHFNAKDTKKGFQYDMVGLNGKYTMPIEAKVSLSVENVKHFAEKRLPFFYRENPQYVAEGEKELLGVMVYERTDPGGAAVQAALDCGLLVFCTDNHKHLTRINDRDEVKEHHPPLKTPRRIPKAKPLRKPSTAKATNKPRQQK